jgi:hypothetical protein
MRFHARVAQFCVAVIAAMMLPGPAQSADGNTSTGLDGLAERYVRLVLAIGEHDPDFVDAYYGPPEWRNDARTHKRSIKELEQEAENLAGQLRAAQAPDAESELRRRALTEQLTSIRTRLELLDGRRLTFDEEARRVYGVSPPHHDDEYYRAVHRELEAVVPGQGALSERMDAFKKRLVVPPERIRAALETALGACRAATLAHIALPPGENFRLELVKDKPWGAYNWYQGNYQSLIQVNVGLPVYASGMARLMGHEGYPGHHVLNTLLEQRLVKARGWIEYTVYPLFSAESLLAEGTADFGLDLVFPGDERWQWERDHLYPVLGIDPALAETSYRVAQLQKALGYAGIDAARAYLDGTRSKEQTIAWLREFTFATPDEARRSIRFMDTYRSYVVNYRLGEDLVRQHIDRVAGTSLDARWSAFEKLLSSPVIVTDLAKGTTLDPDSALPAAAR